MSDQAGRTFGAVCFDCDSTLSRIEGIDELAIRAGVAAQIAPLTTAAMDGAIPIDEIYAERMRLVRPGRASLAWLGERYIEEMVKGARETVAQLQRLGKAVYIVSGGLLPAIVPLAVALGIQRDRVHAVDVFFDDRGDYRDFDRQSPLARADGKADVCRVIAGHHGSVALIGDGVTDLAARAGGAYVVGYGGVVARDVVKDGADVFVANEDLTTVLAAILSEEERRHADDGSSSRVI